VQVKAALAFARTHKGEIEAAVAADEALAPAHG